VPRDLDLYVVSLTGAIFPSPTGFVFVGTQVRVIFVEISCIVLS
jgi:hypothetical protein